MIAYAISDARARGETDPHGVAALVLDALASVGFSVNKE